MNCEAGYTSIQNEFFIVKDRTNSVRQLLSQRVTKCNAQRYALNCFLQNYTGASIAIEKRKVIDARKFGYDVSTSPRTYDLVGTV